MQKIQCMLFRTIIIVTLFLNAVGSTAQVNLNQGLMAYYPFSGNANDSSGNGNNPSFNNAKLTADRFGNPNKAYEFNGSSSYIQIPNRPTLNAGNKLSISIWVKANGFYQGACTGNYLLSKGIASVTPNLYDALFGNGPYGVYKGINFCSTTLDTNHQSFYGAALGNYNFLTPNVHTGQWYHVVFVYNGSVNSLFVNNVLVDQSTSSTNFTNTSDLIFGKYPTGVYWFNGVLDDIRIYNRDLSLAEVKALYTNQVPLSTCNNYLQVTNRHTGVNIGDLTVTGNKLTLEAVFNRTQTYDTVFHGGDIISKHSGPPDANYLLRPNLAYIRTNNGFFRADAPCLAKLNTKYHVALVYDGTSLAFYRNGILLKKVNASGNLVTNSLSTMIGATANLKTTDLSDFIGYINEVRIWNVARTQAQIKQYMDSSLPNPSTQTGLLAYYNFNSLTNLQGNAAWNGSIVGNATINKAIPSCGSLIPDTCTITLGYTLKSFTARPLENAFAAVHFSTVNEVNTALIVAERSENGAEFIPVGTLVAKGGTKENQYDLIDKGLAVMSKIYYRLKMVDKDGSFQYSHVVSVELHSKTNTKPLSAELFPNPLKGSSATLNIYSAKEQSVTLTVFEFSGKIILSKTFNATKGYTQIGLKELSTMKAGTYSLRLASDTDVVIQKMIKAD